jgi:hypothetical protein
MVSLSFLMFLLIKILMSIDISLCPTKKKPPTGTLRKNLGNGNFADFLAIISVNFIESGAYQNQAQFWRFSRSGPIRPDQAQSGRSIGIARINQNQAQPDPIRPNQTQLGVNFGDAPNRRPDFGNPILVMCQSAIGHHAEKRCAAAVPCLPR